MYGDLVLWKQTLKMASEKGTGIILVSDDNKEDWWWRHKGLTLGPRPELVSEMREVAGTTFYMYNSVRFLEQARQYLDQAVSDEALEEAERVRSRIVLDDESLFPGKRFSETEIEEMLAQGFSGPATCRIVGVTYRQLDYWVRTGVISPSVAEAQGSGTQRLFSRRDLVELLLIRRLLDNGLSLQRVRQGLDGLQDMNDAELLRTTVAITSRGPRILSSPMEVVDILEHGDGVSAISVSSMDRELDERLEALTRHEEPQ